MNELNLFAGWIDIPLIEQGLAEAHKVAKHCRKFDYDIAFTSNLERARETLQVIISYQKKIGIFEHERDARYNNFNKAPEKFTTGILPVVTSEKLNERSYGELQGLDKNEAARIYGESQVFQWRRGFKDRPPQGESLEDVYNRVVPYFKKHIHPVFFKGGTVLVVAHGNTLRALIKYLEHISDDQIPFIYLPTGRPLVYFCTKGHVARVEGRYRFDRPLDSLSSKNQ